MSHRKTCTHQTGPSGQGGLADLPGQVVSQAMAQAPLGASGWNGIYFYSYIAIICGN